MTVFICKRYGFHLVLPICYNTIPTSLVISMTLSFIINVTDDN